MSASSKKTFAENEAVQSPAIRQQYGALPYRVAESSGLEILLVTSRETKRWIVPKGWPIKGLKPSKTAAREAYEEAGVRGVVGSKSIGAYVYDKRLNEKAIVVPCEVRVFPLWVRRQEKIWPEMHQREIRWFAPDDAIASVGENELKAIIAQFVSRWNS